MPIIEPLSTSHGCTLGARVTGVDLAALGADAWAAIRDAFHEHALLIFPGQHLSAPAQLAFARRFGEIEILVEGQPNIAISNRDEHGEPLREDSTYRQLLRGNEGWHTDSSYMPLAAKASVLSAQVVPPTGGETEWADMRAAYDALAPALRERIAALHAAHSLYYSQARIGAVARSGDFYGFGDEAAPRRPLVKVHPVTGRPSLFIGRHACDLPGMSAAESERLLDELMAFACQPPRVHAHAWTPGDVAVWDNRCLLHRARPYDDAHARAMRHTRVRGEPGSEMALTIA
ncbi:MAG: TauD/TfdA family dioxygenase [Gammaproteobacteria bacterium]|nr:TauD/TfdA family dioxygenase [Gammaproteobacteria bacterium]